MRAEVIGGGAPARVVDDEPDVERLGLGCALPRLAEEPGLLVGRQRLGFADVDLRRPQPQHGRDDGVEDVGRRARSAGARRARVARRARPPRRAAAARRRSCPPSAERSSETSTPTSRTVIDHDLPIAGRLERRREMGHEMRLPDRHEHVAGPDVELIQADSGRREQLERVERWRAGRRPSAPRHARSP